MAFEHSHLENILLYEDFFIANLLKAHARALIEMFKMFIKIIKDYAPKVSTSATSNF